MNPLAWISLIWVISELGVSFITRSKKSSSAISDKHSLTVIWIVLCISVTLGVFLSVTAVNPSAICYYSGIILILAGIVFRWLAILSLRHLFTSNVAIQRDHVLKTDGMYRYVRHPSYSGSLLSFLGLGVSLGYWPGLLIILCPILLAFLYRIKVEESALLAHFGETYRLYMKNTKKIVPFIF
jgi:protein-S-isoprenylcysteine O-methyltransferase Ste14